MSTHARRLAEALSARTDEDLAALFARRQVRTDSGWNDFFDAAEGLFDQASLARVLPRLDRHEAAALVRASRGHEPGSAADALRDLALLPPSGTVPAPAVVTAIAGRDEPRAADPLPPQAGAHQEQQARAAERAFTTVATLADALLLVGDAGLALLTAGTVGLSEKRRLVERGLPDDPLLLDDLLSLGADSGLLVAVERTLRLAADGAQWLRLPWPDRWVRLVSGFRAALPRALRTATGGWIPLPLWSGAYPWDPAWPDRAHTLIRQGHLLGLDASEHTEENAPFAETPWALAPRQGGEPDPALLAPFVPSEVDRIFLQNDLTAIAPGPLLPALDLRLRTMATRESVRQASSYRFSPDSLSTALSSGETAQQILDFLEEISLTGVPQPLRYLLTQSAGRHGQVQVGADPETGRTWIRSDDPHLLQAIGVDQALRPLGLVPVDDALITRVNRHTVFWALSDEHYPAALVDEQGRAERPRRGGAVATTATSAPSAQERYAALIARLRDHDGEDADAAWLQRELEHAAKQRMAVIVEVAMPDGSARELVLEVTGFGGGRLRGRDLSGDVERTLPIRSIRAARPVDDAED